MQDHIGKPIDPDQLYRVLARWAKPDATVPISGAAPAPSKPDGGSAEVPSIDGVDTTTGLMRTGGRAPQYLNLLRRFTERHAGNAHEIADAIAGGDNAVGQRLAHTLKGVAATLGIDAVSAAARRVEMGLADGDAVDDAIGELDRELAPVIVAITAALPAPGEILNGAHSTPAECADQLRALRTLLEHDDGDAAELIAKIAPGLVGVLGQNELAALSRTVSEYDFPAALTTLDGVCKRLSLEFA
jgi:HPt (histidine-containing phosphotransfer) domain-containing protein